MQTMPNTIINENTRSFLLKDLENFMQCENKAKEFIYAYRGACSVSDWRNMEIEIKCTDLDTLCTNYKNDTFSG